jgi:hypothetical protein
MSALKEISNMKRRLNLENSFSGLGSFASHQKAFSALGFLPSLIRRLPCHEKAQAHFSFSGEAPLLAFFVRLQPGVHFAIPIAAVATNRPIPVWTRWNATEADEQACLACCSAATAAMAIVETGVRFKV